MNVVADHRVPWGICRTTSSTDPNRYNFQGTCGKGTAQSFWCAYDAY